MKLRAYCSMIDAGNTAPMCTVFSGWGGHRKLGPMQLSRHRKLTLQDVTIEESCKGPKIVAGL